ncbi:MAG: hypothetical protein HKO59_06600 [Phycisphaerales bacterium]|nr:hypothetical protein [Phycisphaerae bacterium]NNF42048.1 hypothetical protein [Phycisphaerales bacterium]NNM25645.1 hypothetical protein [Phycisphaerales bacterium]
MPVCGEFITVVIGGSRPAESLRRSLQRAGAPNLGVTGHLRGLRRGLVAGQGPVVVCVALDQPTLTRHATELRRLLADLQQFPCVVGSVGLLGADGLTAEAAAVGCDVYASSVAEATGALRHLRETNGERGGVWMNRMALLGDASRWGRVSSWHAAGRGDDDRA